MAAGLRFRVQFPVPVLGDNEAAEQTASVPETKYARNINLREHWIRSVMRFGDLTLAHIPSEWNVADIYTKALSSADFEKFVELLLKGIHNIEYQSKILHTLRDVWARSHQRDLQMKREAAKLGESKAVAPTAENDVLQISGVVSGKRNVMCSAMAQRPSLMFSMADVSDATGMPLSVCVNAVSKRPRVSFAGDDVEVICDVRAPTMFTVQSNSSIHRSM